MAKKTEAPAAVHAQFDAWSKPRRGHANPEIQTNDVWSWLITTCAHPHAAHQNAGTGEKPAPIWCFDRFGQSTTHLADGTVVYIGGEHEDHYDPDFYIYNDVVVVRPGSSIEVYGYPTHVFPPTDFHTATLVGGHIFLIGGLRYPENRLPNETLVFCLNLRDFSIERVITKGKAPCWLYNHRAVLDEARCKIICSGGEVTHPAAGRTVENLSEWEFDCATKTWAETGKKSYTRFLLVREDEGLNELWGIENFVRGLRLSQPDALADQYEDRFKARGHSVDAETYRNRLVPPLDHKPIATNIDDENYDHRTHRIEIDGVTVRYVEDMHEIAVTVEGYLDADKIETLKQHGVETYAKLEGVPYKSITI